MQEKFTAAAGQAAYKVRKQAIGQIFLVVESCLGLKQFS
jgi:hypothetical protein